MNWLEIAAIALIIIMAIVGYIRGFVKMIVGLAAMVIALLASAFLAPQLSDYIINQTEIRNEISAQINAYLQEELGEKLEETAADAQLDAIEELPLPDNIKTAIMENNTADTYVQMGVETFSEYVSSYTAELVIDALSYIIVFLGIYIVLRVLFSLLNIVAHLPFLNGVNKMAGGVLGIVHAFVYIWIFFCLATAAMSSSFGQNVLSLTAQSSLLTFLYQYNPLL